MGTCLGACSRTGTLTGQISVTVSDGVRRGDGADVILMRAEPFGEEWTKLGSEFQTEVFELGASLDELRETRRELQTGIDAAERLRVQAAVAEQKERAQWEREVQIMIERMGIRQYSTSYSLNDASRRHRQAQRLVTEAAKALADATERREHLKGQIQQAVERYDQRALELLERHRFKATKADVIGYFELPGLPAGSYYLAASFPLDAGVVRWVVPLEVRGGRHRFDFSSANASWPFTVEIAKD